MRFNKEEKTKRVFLIGFEEVSEEAFINIELTQQEANMLYLALNIRSTTTMKETFNKMLSEVVESEVE